MPLKTYLTDMITIERAKFACRELAIILTARGSFAPLKSRVRVNNCAKSLFRAIEVLEQEIAEYQPAPPAAGYDADPPIRSVAERLTDLIGYPPDSITGEGPR